MNQGLSRPPQRVLDQEQKTEDRGQRTLVIKVELP